MLSYGCWINSKSHSQFLGPLCIWQCFFKILKIENWKRMKIQFSRARGSERGQYFSRFETLAHYWVKVVFFAPNIFLQIFAEKFTGFLALRKYYRTYLQNFLRSKNFFTKQNGKNRKYSQLLYKKELIKVLKKELIKVLKKELIKLLKKVLFWAILGNTPYFLENFTFLSKLVLFWAFSGKAVFFSTFLSNFFTNALLWVTFMSRITFLSPFLSNFQTIYFFEHYFE